MNCNLCVRWIEWRVILALWCLYTKHVDAALIRIKKKWKMLCSVQKIKNKIIITIITTSVKNHHKMHLSTGFIALPTGQLNNRAKSCELLIGPRILKRSGLCTSVRILCSCWALRSTPQHELANEMKNNWSALNWSRPGRLGSTPCSET